MHCNKCWPCTGTCYALFAKRDPTALLCAGQVEIMNAWMIYNIPEHVQCSTQGRGANIIGEIIRKNPPLLLA